MSGRYMSALQQENQSINNYYTNSRYAPTGDQQVGLPFPMYKQYGGLMTDWRPAGSRASTLMKEANLPTNTNFFRQAMTQNAIGLGNTNNVAWVSQTQSLQNVGNPLLCNNNADCSAYPGTTCNKNYESWPDAKGNQSGAFCSQTVYPELQDGVYHRKDISQGGIGRACQSDSDCGSGYSCNNNTDFVGKNIQQTGFCAQKYQCPDGSTHYLGYPYNSGIPQPPPREQNRKGQGYSSKEECQRFANAQQDCVASQSGSWYATYPGYCPVPANMRQGGPKGPIPMSSPSEVSQGFSIPAYATNNSSNWGSKTAGFESWKLTGNLKGHQEDSMQSAWSYAKSLDPNPGFRN